MKRQLCVYVVFFSFLIPPSQSRADLFGGDVVVLAQILSNAIQQLMQLRQILSTGQNNLDLLREINRGINDSLQVIRTINPNQDPGLYKNWDNVQTALNAVEELYGGVIPSEYAQSQRDADQSVAETVTLNNSIYNYAKDVDDLGERIKEYSHQVSPGGAQKLTAQSMGIMLHVMTTQLRAQSTGLKLQAQSLAIQNKEDKSRTRSIAATSDALEAALESQSPTFTLPRF